MKRILVILCLITIYPALKSQISIQTNLPKKMPLNSEVAFEVRINKGNTSNFAKYQFQISGANNIEPLDVKSGSFTYEENLAKIIWVMAPAEPEISLSFKLFTGGTAGVNTLEQKYFYIEDENNKEVDMEVLEIMFSDSIPTQVFSSVEEFVSVSPKTGPSLLTTTINAADLSITNPQLLIQQVMQLKKDSKDAYVVGEREKKKAELKLSEANEAIKKAEAIDDSVEREAALDKANVLKQKAEQDMEVAQRVLTLAKALEDNANEIEVLSRSVNSGSQPVQSGSEPFIALGNQRTPSTANETATTVDLDDLQGSDSESRRKASGNSIEPAEQESGLVYKIQLGAFSKEPSRKDFRALDKVKVIKENGMYKVLYGVYTSKDEALKQREKLLGKGFDGFIVAYQDGMRVK